MSTDEQSLSFDEFLESEIQIDEIKTATLIRWMRDPACPSRTHDALLRQVFRRKNMAEGYY